MQIINIKNGKNLLKNNTIYLSSSIDYAPDKGYGWREYITPFLMSLNMKVINPLIKPIISDYLNNEAELQEKCKKYKDSGEYDRLKNIGRVIRNVDLRFVDKSDIILVYYDIKILMTGTLEEIFLANRQKKPIILMSPSGIRDIPNWLFWALDYKLFFEDWGSVKNCLVSVNNGETKYLSDRWVFFN